LHEVCLMSIYVGEGEKKTPLCCVVGSCLCSFVSGFDSSLDSEAKDWSRRVRRKKENSSG